MGLTPRTIQKVAVIGGGLMGSGIATAFILSNVTVILKEVNSEFLQRGMKMVAGTYAILDYLVPHILIRHYNLTGFCQFFIQKFDLNCMIFAFWQ